MTVAYTTKSRRGAKFPKAKFPSVTTRSHNEISPHSSLRHILMWTKSVPGLGTWSERQTHPFSTWNKAHVQRTQSALHLCKPPPSTSTTHKNPKRKNGVNFLLLLLLFIANFSKKLWVLFYPQLFYYQTGASVFYLLFAAVHDGCMWWKADLWDS